MKTQGNHKSKFRSFYAALAVSLIMIFAACFFAYRQTSQTLEQNLDSLTEQLEVPATTVFPPMSEAPAVEIQTDVPLEPTETESQTVAAETAPAVQETVAETAIETAPAETTAEETPVHQYVPPLANFSVLAPFSNGELVKSETTGTWQTHNGVDLSCATGSDVFAIDTGTIREVSNDALWGYTVTIDHDNGILSRYCGLDGSLSVQQGDTIQSGQKIGIIGKSPDLESALESHLHLEVQKNGVYTDPLAYFEE